MSSNIIGADHEFHSKEFAKDWSDRFVPSPERLRLFELIHTTLERINSPTPKVVELGIGPGYLANYLLERQSHLSYCGIDFSEPMLDIARERLKPFSTQTTFKRADLIVDAWNSEFLGQADAIISTWALHDLGHLKNIHQVYQKAFQALKEGGLLINGDFIKPEGSAHEFEGGRILLEEHFTCLKESKFDEIECLSLFEIETMNPTAAQNYACIYACKN